MYHILRGQQLCNPCYFLLDFIIFNNKTIIKTLQINVLMLFANIMLVIILFKCLIADLIVIIWVCCANGKLCFLVMF